MQSARYWPATSLLGAVLFFVVLIWWDLHGFRDDYRRTTVPDRLETTPLGWTTPLASERNVGETDEEFVTRHINEVLEAERGGR